MQPKLIKQISSAVDYVERNRQDFCVPVEELKDHLLLVKADDRKHAYIFDYRDIGKPRSIKLVVKQATVVRRFNLYDAIIPKDDL